MYIKTRYCYVYSYGDEAILKIDSNFGFNIGELIFISSNDKCDIEKIIE